MTLRTPRRRISPRAKRRYRVIRDFFRRALGSSSQQEIKINSSIAVNVTDLKHKIVGIEHQLNEVSRHCQDLACIESTIRKGAENLLATECNCQHEVACSVQGSTLDVSDKKSVPSTTKTLFNKPLDTLRRKSDESDYVFNANYRSIEERKHMTLPANMAHEQRYSHLNKHRQRKNKVDDRLRVGYDEQNFQKRRTRSTLETFGAATSYAETSYHSLAPPPPHTECPPRSPRALRTARAACVDRKHSKHYDHTDGLIYDEVPGKRHTQRPKRNKSASPQRYQDEKLDRYREEKIEYVRDDKLNRSRKTKKERSKVDSDYITELIQKQYRPTKVFGRRNSEISQFSVPVCRDQEYSLHESIQEGADLCSCCYEREAYRPTPHRSPRRSQCRHTHYDCRSVCDARLYSSKRARTPHRYRHIDIYNDSTLYDVVPVKEKPSPKSRRKFVEDNIIGYEYYKEVPPSPRTHRPRLNLKAQHHADYEDYVMNKHTKRYSPERHKRHYDYPNEFFEGDEVNPNFVHHKEKCKQLKPIKVQTSIPIEQENEIPTMSNLQGNSFQNEPALTLTENTFNKTQDTEGSDKTDKALCEIKDILQCFLQEIKKETPPTDKESLNQNNQTTDAAGAAGASAAGKIGVTPMIAAPTLPIMPSYTVAQCSIPNNFTPFTNPCCYPTMMPMCPVNCMQTGCPARSASCTCHAFSPNKETICEECTQKKGTQEAEKNHETDELIKEIYKFVTLNPHSARKRNPDHKKEGSGKKLTSRSVGDSSRVSRHDANVATSAMKCYSKSCEAIGSRMITETSYTTTQSDTGIEKLSLDVSQSDSELTTEINVRGKSKPKSKLTSVLKGLFKKKKTDTESSFEVDILPKERRPPPFRQEVYDYAMHEQEFYHIPTYAPGYDPFGYVPPPPGCEHRGPYYAPGPSAPPGSYTPHRVHEQTIPEHEPHYHRSHANPSAPPYHDPYALGYDPHYNPQASQVPLCLKEIEVKSTGTQSERKMSLFRKFSRKTPPGTSVRSELVPPQPRFTEATQTQQTQKLPSEPSRPLFPAWKKFQEKVQKDLSEDPLMYNYKTKQKLMEGDKKLKTAMVKKMFYKRNPFSPNNLIIRTLLGNDPSSFGEPNVTLKPRIFF